MSRQCAYRKIVRTKLPTLVRRFIPLYGSLNKFYHCLAHLHPLLVHQVELVSPSFRLAPLIPPVGLEVPLGAILQYLGGLPDPIGLEPGGSINVVVLIELFNPVIELTYLLFYPE